jgi:hypothetical protein
MAGYIGNDPAKSSVRIARQKYTSSASQTDFTFTAGYDPGYLEVYVNGVRQTEGTNFTAIGAGNTVTAAAYKTFNVATVTLGEVTDVDDLTVTGAINAGSADVGIATINSSGIDAGVGIITAGSYYGDGSNLSGVGVAGVSTTVHAGFNDITVAGVSTVGVLTVTTSAVVGNAVTMTSSAFTVDQGVTATFNNDVNFQGGNYNIKRNRALSSIDFDDNAKARFGNSPDLDIYHNGSNSYIKNSTGGLVISSADGQPIQLAGGQNLGEVLAKFTDNASCELYYDNSKKLETSGVGVTVTGDVTATTFTGSGANLTNLPASGDSNDITACLFI